MSGRGHTYTSRSRCFWLTLLLCVGHDCADGKMNGKLLPKKESQLQEDTQKIRAAVEKMRCAKQ
jgi:hypothetical protein